MAKHNLPEPPRVVTPEGMLSFPSLVTKREFNGRKQYDCRIFFDKGTDLWKLAAAQEEALEARFGADWAKDRKIKLALVAAGDGNNMDNYAGVEPGMMTLGAWTEGRIALIDNVRTENGTLASIETEEDAQEKFYAGARVRLSLTALTYDYQGSRGVRFALDGVQFLKHGQKLGGGGSRDVRGDFDDGDFDAEDDLLD